MGMLAGCCFPKSVTADFKENVPIHPSVLPHENHYAEEHHLVDYEYRSPAFNEKIDTEEDK